MRSASTRRLALLSSLLVAASLLVRGGTVSASVETTSTSFSLRSSKVAGATETDNKHSRKNSHSLVHSIVNKERKASSPSPAAVVRGGKVANTLPNAVAGSVVLALIEQVAKKALAKADINFPSMLAGCIGLFFFLLVTDFVNPTLAASMYDALSPASALLTKWFTPLFVPGLVMLPLTPSVGGGAEIAKVIGTVIIGWVYSMLTTTLVVVAIRQAQGTLVTGGGVVKKAAAGARVKPYSEADWNLLWKGTVVTGLISILATRANHAYANPLEMVFLTFLTLATFIWSANLPSSYVKAVHPLVTGSVLVSAFFAGLAAITNRDFGDVLRAYRAKSLAPMHMGGGDLLMYMLGPCVVSFSLAMYSRRQLLFQNLLVIMSAVLVASTGGLFGTAAFCRLVSLGGTGANAKLLRLSMIGRNITMALALALTNMIGGDTSITASAVCLTGIMGSTYGKSLLTAMGIRDPICRGLGMGGSSQGLGVAAIADEPEAFPFAASAMVLTAVSAVTLVAIPSVQSALIRLATGGLSSTPSFATP